MSSRPISEPIPFDLPRDWSCGICQTSTLSGDKRTLSKLSGFFLKDTCGHVFHKICYDRYLAVPSVKLRLYEKYCHTCKMGVQTEMVQTFAEDQLSTK